MCDFFVYSLPRSGSAWLANLFTTGETFCYHELSGKTLSFMNYEIACREIGKKYKYHGNSDPGNIYLAPWLLSTYPDAKILVVHRDVEVVHQSLLKQGIDDKRVLVQTQKALQQLGTWNKSIQFSDIFNEDVMYEVWKHLEIPTKFDYFRFSALKDFVINIRSADALELGDFTDLNKHLDPEMRSLIYKTINYYMED